MDNNQKNREDNEPVQLDDLLDQILQKNMEDAVMRSDPRSDLKVFSGADLDALSDTIEEARIGRKETREVFEEVPKDTAMEEKEISSLDSLIEGAVEAEEDSMDTECSEDAVPVQEDAEGIAEEGSDEPVEDEEDLEVIEVEVGTEDDSKITKKDVLSMIAYVVVIFLLTFFIVHFVGQRTRVSGSSMENTLSNGDNLIVDKISYRLSDPKRFDIIIFPYRFDPKTYYIKRIIGLPGETVRIDLDGNIYVNGELLEEDYGLETILDPGMAIDPITLGEDEYFVLGDNRNNSSDSRFSGVANVKRETIIGRAFVRIYPFDHITLLH